MNRPAGVLGIVLAVSLSQCERDPTGPTSFPLTVQLANAGSSDRGMLVQIAGADTSARIDTVTAPSGSPYRVFVRRLSRTQWRAIVTGNLADGAVLTIRVPDPSRTTAYTGTILDVADASFAAVTPGTRSLSVSP